MDLGFGDWDKHVFGGAMQWPTTQKAVLVFYGCVVKFLV